MTSEMRIIELFAFGGRYSNRLVYRYYYEISRLMRTCERRTLMSIKYMWQPQRGQAWGDNVNFKTRHESGTNKHSFINSAPRHLQQLLALGYFVPGSL